MYSHQCLPANSYTVAEFLSNVRTVDGKLYRPASLQRFVVSIRKKHKQAQLQDPTTAEAIKMVLSSKKRSELRPTTEAKAMSLQELELQMALLSNNGSNKALRDKLLLLLGFGGGFRRSELADLKVDDITFKAYGFDILVRKSKTDQHGKGFTKQFVRSSKAHMCPVATLENYLEKFQPT